MKQLNNAAEELIANISDIDEFKDNGTQTKVQKNGHNKDGDKTFGKYKIKDIVFLAMMSAAMLVIGAVMPLVGQIPLFGIIQLCLGLQFSIFPVIGMMKVRKPGALLFISLFCGSLMVFMNTIMFFCMLICALIAETLALLIFKSYKKDAACLLAGAVYFPLTLPFLYIWYKFIYTWTGEEGQAVSAFVGSSSGAAVAISLAVVAVCFIGALIGTVISKELKKSGVMKK